MPAVTWIGEQPRLPAVLVMVVSLTALLVAYLAEVWGGLDPCILCIYQRYVYGAAFAIGLLGAVLGSPRFGRVVMLLAGLTFLVGFGVAVFNVGVEQHWWRGTAACHAPSIDLNQSLDDLRSQLLDTKFAPCDRVAWSLFGLSIAGYNAIASLALAAASLWAAAQLGGRRRA